MVEVVGVEEVVVEEVVGEVGFLFSRRRIIFWRSGLGVKDGGSESEKEIELRTIEDVG